MTGSEFNLTGKPAAVTFRENLSDAARERVEAEIDLCCERMNDGLNFEQWQMRLAVLEERYPLMSEYLHRGITTKIPVQLDNGTVYWSDY